MEVNGLERIKHANVFNYTEDQLAEKKLALHNLSIIYPDVNKYYAELVYDMCMNTSQEEIDILKEKCLETFKYKERYSTLQEELDLVTTHTAVQCTANTNGITVFSTHTHTKRQEEEGGQSKRGACGLAKNQFFRVIRTLSTLLYKINFRD